MAGTVTSKLHEEEHSQQTAKAHFSAISSFQHVPLNITDTREFAGEITGNKGLGFITLYIFTRFILHFWKT